MTGMPARQGRLAENVMHFGRLLRAAGLPVGPDRVLDALEALRISDVERRDDLYWTLAAVFLDRHDRLTVFDEAFRLFWRDPELGVRALRLPPVQGRIPPGEREPQISKRLAQALFRQREHPGAAPLEKVTFDASLTFSARESLQTMDFESMSSEELAAARAAIARLKLRLPRVRTRRYAPHARGERIDPRASLRASLRVGGATIPLKRRSVIRRPPPLVVLCDVSGSMNRYTRMFLHFLHATVNDRDRVHALTFGTRLTSVTRHLQYSDPDVALARVSRIVKDWSGGTRIGACLKEFNARWSRRLLGQGAIVLLVSDGLDCDAGTDLAQQMERLSKSCRRLIWLNPLLRYDAFEAKPAGIQAMLPWVDEFLPAHNVESLEDLARVLAHGRQRPATSSRPSTKARPGFKVAAGS
jgi:uncharacterized protein with von Willebrand factor type A (vWA) domain